MQRTQSKTSTAEACEAKTDSRLCEKSFKVSCFLFHIFLKCLKYLKFEVVFYLKVVKALVHLIINSYERTNSRLSETLSTFTVSYFKFIKTASLQETRSQSFCINRLRRMNQFSPKLDSFNVSYFTFHIFKDRFAVGEDEVER